MGGRTRLDGVLAGRFDGHVRGRQLRELLELLVRPFALSKVLSNDRF